MKKIWLIGIITCFSIIFHAAFACTDFRLQAKDGTVLITRTLEFGEDLKSNLRSSTRERLFATTAPDGKAGLSWKSKYGYVYLDGLNQDIAVDGMNEQGLSFEYLYLPGETQYQSVIPGKENQALPYYHFGDWVLGNFKTIDEVKQALANVQVYGANLPGINTIFPLHAAIYDASGKGIVVEFVNGNMNVYDNIGIMTNSPTYPWHVTNLRNYLNLSPYVPKPITVNGITYATLSQGTGMLGLPGDFSPPSRFVKTSVLVETALQANTSADVLNLAQHIINNVDIALGTVRAKDSSQDEWTQWTVFKDLTHKIFYYRTYNDMTVRYVILDKINFAANADRLKMPLVGPSFLKDVTRQFLNIKNGQHAS